MKARVLTSIIAFLFLSVSIYSQNRTETSIRKDERGYTTKECINYKRTTENNKTVYLYSPDNNLIQRISYQWDNHTGWAPVQRYSFEYNTDGRVANVICTKWDQDKNIWAKKSKCIAHIYSENGKTVQETEIDTRSDSYYTQK